MGILPLELLCTVCHEVVLTAPRHLPLPGDELVRRTTEHYAAAHAGQRLPGRPAIQVARGRRIDLRTAPEQRSAERPTDPPRRR